MRCADKAPATLSRSTQFLAMKVIFSVHFSEHLSICWWGSAWPMNWSIKSITLLHLFHWFFCCCSCGTPSKTQDSKGSPRIEAYVPRPELRKGSGPRDSKRGGNSREVEKRKCLEHKVCPAMQTIFSGEKVICRLGVLVKQAPSLMKISFATVDASYQG